MPFIRDLRCFFAVQKVATEVFETTNHILQDTGRKLKVHMTITRYLVQGLNVLHTLKLPPVSRRICVVFTVVILPDMASNFSRNTGQNIKLRQPELYKTLRLW